MSRPKCEVGFHISGGWCMRDGDCATCEAKHNGTCARGLFVFTPAEKIAALIAALKELTGKDYAEVMVGCDDKKPPKEAGR